MIAHARLFSRVISCAMCEWTLEEEKEAFLPPNFKSSIDRNKFYYLLRHWDFDGDALGETFRKQQTVSGLLRSPLPGAFISHTDSLSQPCPVSF